jgi:hypothetical protein
MPMLKNIDRAFGYLLILASCGHTAGTFKWVPFMSGMFVWSLGSSLAAALLGVLNIVRAGRLDDKTLAVITAAGTTGWALVALGFGKSIHNMLDPRVLGNVFIAVVLVLFSAVALRQSSRYKS